MYLRFRNSQISAPKSDSAFEELYQKIHRKPPKQAKLVNKPFFKVQIYLVRNQRINKKPRQIYIGSLANTTIFICRDKKVLVDNNFWTLINDRMLDYSVPDEIQAHLKGKIESYLECLKFND